MFALCADTPENCHFNVKELPKTCQLKIKTTIDKDFVKKITNGIFWKKISFGIFLGKKSSFW